MKKSKKDLFLYGLLAVMVLPILYWYFYIPHNEYSFLREIEKEFRKTKSQTIKIEALTDFDWDAVCVFSQYSILPPTSDERALAKAFEKTYKYNYENIKGHLPSRWSPAF